MTRDPRDFPEPERFNPDRFIGADGCIDPTVRDPSTIVFGFGRRCGVLDPHSGVRYANTYLLPSQDLSWKTLQQQHPLHVCRIHATSIQYDLRHRRIWKSHRLEHGNYRLIDRVRLVTIFNL